MSFAVDLLDTTAVAPGPFYLSVATDHVADGYVIEVDTLWDSQGRLAAQAQQNIALIT